MWKSQKISEGDARQKQKYRGKQESSHRGFFIAIKRRRYKQPDLIQNHWRRHNNTHVNAEFDQQAQIIRRPGVIQLSFYAVSCQRTANGDGNDVDELWR